MWPVVLSITFLLVIPLLWYTNRWPPDMNRYEPLGYWTGNRQKTNKTVWEWTLSGQPLESYLLVVCSEFWTCTKLRIHWTSTDVNIHVTDKTDMDGWVSDDQRSAIYSIHYSSIPSIHSIVTGALHTMRLIVVIKLAVKNNDFNMMELALMYPCFCKIVNAIILQHLWHIIFWKKNIKEIQCL